jgi:hypothetical protein
MIRILLLTTAIAVGFAASATAQGLRGERPDFDALDLDGDGALSPAEVEAFRAGRTDERFATLDADGDGTITRAEMQAAPAARASARAERFATRFLREFDADGDGALTRAELESGARARQGDRQGRLFERVDADGDGTISEAEFAAIREAMGRHGPGRGRAGGGFFRQ